MRYVPPEAVVYGGSTPCASRISGANTFPDAAFFIQFSTLYYKLLLPFAQSLYLKS